MRGFLFVYFIFMYMKLIDLIPLKEIEFNSQKDLDNYKKTHNVRKGTTLKVRSIPTQIKRTIKKGADSISKSWNKFSDKMGDKAADAFISTNDKLKKALDWQDENIKEGHCIRKDGESDEDFLTRCGNPNRIPNGYNDRETSGIKLQKLMAKKKLPKDMKWNQGFQLEADVVNDNEIDRNDVLLNKLTKALIKIRKKDNVLELNINEIDTADHPKDCKCKDCVGNDNELDILGTDLDETQEDWMARKTQEILEKYKETRLKGLKEADINKPSPKLRPEPHPTRHETEHPPYEKDAMKSKMKKFTPPTKK